MSMTVQSRSQAPVRLVLTALMLSILTACGGGGGGGGGGHSDSGNLPGTGPGNGTGNGDGSGGENKPGNGGNEGNGNGGGTDNGWRPSAPVAAPTSASSFKGVGVNVGVLDSGFDADSMTNHPAAVAGVMKGVINGSDATAGSHGAIVSRVLAGSDIGDGFGNASANGVNLYQANLPTMVTAAKVSSNLTGLNANGVKIVNNSWSLLPDPKYLLPSGSEAAFNSPTYQAFMPVFWQAVNINKQLLVWANGNESQANPYLLAGAPYVDFGLQKGWLTVTQIENGALASWSNACGVAANWCLSAEAPNGLTGTSFAAPVVSAAAAQVSQAFPWMDNSALRQTILSTADTMGNTALYGWGKLNADKAVRGPALFDTRLTLGGDFQADFDGYRSEFFNDIGGNAGLNKNGNGSLVLWGNNTFAGDTTITGGRVELYGAVASGVAIAGGGELVGDHGVIGKSVSNAGKVTVNGTGLTVNGDYTAASASATLGTQLGSTLTVGGTATLNGSNLIALKPDDRYVVKGKETALKAGAVSGVFGHVSADSALLYDVSAEYTGTQVDLNVARRSVSTAAQSYYQGQTARQAAADAVETAFLATDAKVQGVESSVTDSFVASAAKLQNVSSTEALAASLDSISGQIHASSQALTFQQSQAVNRALCDRLDAIGGGTAQTGLWANMIGSKGKLQQSGFAGADTSMYGGQFGIDRRLSSDALLGAAFTWSDAKADFDNYGGNSKSQGLGLSLYGRYGADVGNYVSGRVGVQWVKTDVKRDVLIDSASSQVKSDRNDRLTSLYGEFGHAFSLNSARLTPFVGLSYDHLDRAAISESGSAFALNANKKSFDQTAAVLGMRLQSNPLSWAGGNTTISGYGAYRYANPTSLNFNASFSGAPDASFTVKGIGLQRHTGWLGLGASTQSGQNLTWFLNYDMQLGRGGVNNNVFSAGLRYAFD